MMTRELKFRFWNCEEKRMESTPESQDGLINVYDNKFIIPNNYFVMQYTGEKDKNGVEIYEGDIMTNNFELYGVVKFVKGEFGVWENDILIWNLSTLDMYDPEPFVIGNIHQYYNKTAKKAGIKK